MKKIFVSALAVLNLLFASAQEEKMDISDTPSGGNTEATTKSTDSSSDDFDSEYFSANNTGSGSSEIKNVIGLRFGGSISQATSCSVASAHMQGLAFGVVDQVWFGERNLFIETGLMYLQKGYSLKGFEPSETKVYYLELPLLWCFRQGREDLCMILKAGGYIACGTKATLKTDISDNPGAIDLFKTMHEYDLFKEGALARFDAGAKFGVAIVVRRVHFGFSYDLGLYKIDKKDLIYGDDELMLGYKDLKNRSFQLMVGFNFQK